MINCDIVIPTLNSTNTLEWTLLNLSKLKSMGICANIIVVDSGSTDGTLEIVKKYGFKCLYFPKGNMYAAINHGLRVGRSYWCTYINSDDILYPKGFAYLLKEVSNTSPDIGYGNIDYIDGDGRFLHGWSSPPSSDLGALFDGWMMPIPQPGTIFSRGIFERLDGFRERFKYSADYDFFLRAYLINAKFVKKNGRPVAAFRIHRDQISQKRSVDMRKEHLESYSQTTKNATTLVRRKFAIFRVKTRNIPNYIIRIIRWYYLNKSLKIPKCLSISRDI